MQYTEAMMQSTPIPDRTREMDERSWWDFWNVSYRAQDGRDAISIELFSHVTGVVRSISPNACRILEVACGTGTLSRQLPFFSYHGLDISHAAIEIATEKADLIQSLCAASRPTYEAADFHDWPLPMEQFDFVICVDAVSCFREQAFVVQKMAQSLRPGGHLVLTSVNPLVYNRIRRDGRVRLENGPVAHWLSRSKLHGLVQQAGLTLQRSYTIMPRGNMGFLRIINARRLSQALGQRGAAVFRRLKEYIGLGQYRVIVALKKGARG